MLSASGVYQVLGSGRTTLVGFERGGVPNHFYYPECKDDLLRLVAETGCETLVFDLTHVEFLPSGLLGLLTSLRHRGLTIRLRHVPECVRLTTRITHLDDLFVLDEDDDPPKPLPCDTATRA